MKEKILDNNIEYFWEYENIFCHYFFKEVFEGTKAKYRRRYSLGGDGIFNLIYIEDKVYELKFKKVLKMLPNDGKKAVRDEIKNDLVYWICNKGLDAIPLEYTVNSGKFITFKIGKYIAQIELIKKTKEPENLGKQLINGEWV